MDGWSDEKGDIKIYISFEYYLAAGIIKSF